MKYLFIFLVVLTIQAKLNASFNLQSKGMLKQVASAENEENKKATQKNYTEMPGRLNIINEMSEIEQKATGISRLNESQKAALSKWVENYCCENKLRQERVAAKASPNAVAAILGDGRYVKMGDGTVWNVSPNGWIYTYYWKIGEVVKASPGPDALFPFTLVNENYPLTVNAQKAAKNITNSFKNEYYITDISSDGKIVTLNNGSKWEVPSSTRYMVSGWANGNSAFVTKVAKASGEHFELFNGNTARSVFVKKLSAGRPPAKLNSQKSRSARNIAIANPENADESENTPTEDPSDDPDRISQP